MKATELRIGNWVMGNKPFQVTGSLIALYEGRQKLHHDTRTLPEPIPLTTEWLEKFGFEKHKDHYQLGKFIYNIHTGWWYRGRKIINYPIYVHQLQNLFHALTGEEL